MAPTKAGVHLLLLGLLLPALVNSLVIQTPDNTTIWDRTGDTRTFIRWALDPPTDPPPRTNLMTIWLRNGAPDMYDPPLNLTLARHVDFVAKQQVEVQDVIDFLPGTGYQLFLADPENATLVYCESPVFDIDDDPQAAYARKLSATDEVTSTPLPTSTSVAVRVAASKAAEPEPNSSTSIATEQDSSSPPPPPPPPSTTEAAPREELTAESSSSWISSITSIFSSSSESPPPPPEDTSRAPVIVRPSPPPIRGDEPPPSSSAEPAAPSSTEEPPRPEPPSTQDEAIPSTSTEEPPPEPTSTSITPPPPSSSSPPPPPPPPPAPSSSSLDSSSSSSSSSRDFYWYYSVSPSASSIPPSSTAEAAKAVATVDSNAPCTCGGGNANSVQNVNTGGGTAFQIIIRPVPGSSGDQGLQLFTAAGVRSSSLMGVKALSGIVISVVSFLYFF
ncbi:hypothetical protein JCM3765_006458 [Sporobolomyces pararoseus]